MHGKMYSVNTKLQNTKLVRTSFLAGPTKGKFPQVDPYQYFTFGAVKNPVQKSEPSHLPMTLLLHRSNMQKWNTRSNKVTWPRRNNFPSLQRDKPQHFWQHTSGTLEKFVEHQKLYSKRRYDWLERQKRLFRKNKKF